MGGSDCSPGLVAGVEFIRYLLSVARCGAQESGDTKALCQAEAVEFAQAGEFCAGRDDHEGKGNPLNPVQIAAL
jgi:hypothetical protein